MKILRRIIRRKLCHPVVIGAAAVVLLFATSEKWTPYIKDRLYQEAATARDSETENSKKKDKTVQQSEVREPNKQESRKSRIEKDADQEKTTAASDVSDKTKASKGKKKKSVKKSVTESKAYQDTAEDVKKTVNDTKDAADKVKKYLDEAKKRGGTDHGREYAGGIRRKATDHTRWRRYGKRHQKKNCRSDKRSGRDRE